MMGKETVVLLHGILRSSFDMKLLENRLEKEGYEVINFSYPSRKQPIELLTAFVHEQLKLSPQFNNAAKVHFVTHSMGGLVTRYYLHAHRPPHLGSVVMLSPPNKGSALADFMMGSNYLKKIYARLFGPAGRQLSEDFKHAVPSRVDFPLGIIAGTSSINPFAKWFLGAKGSHDGIVALESMKLKGMKDMIELPTSHTLMPFSPAVGEQVVHFLKHEKFDRPAPKPPSSHP